MAPSQRAARARLCRSRVARLQQNVVLGASISLQHLLRAVRQRQHPQRDLWAASALGRRVLRAPVARLQLLRVQLSLAVDVYQVKKLRRKLEALLRRHLRANLRGGISAPLRHALRGALACMLDSWLCSATVGAPYACTTVCPACGSSALAERVSARCVASGTPPCSHPRQSG